MAKYYCIIVQNTFTQTKRNRDIHTQWDHFFFPFYSNTFHSLTILFLLRWQCLPFTRFNFFFSVDVVVYFHSFVDSFIRSVCCFFSFGVFIKIIKPNLLSFEWDEFKSANRLCNNHQNKWRYNERTNGWSE